MTTEVKGFKTRTGEKIIISPAPHEHTSGQISDLESTIESKIQEEITDLDLSNKVNKVSNGSEDNFVSLDENGNIKDSGYCSENFASSNHTHSEYANKSHSHSYISDSGLQNAATISTDGTDGSVEILVANGANSKSVTIDKDNIGNLIRALTNPDDEPDEGSNSLITSGAVYTALANASGLTVDSSLTPGGNNAVKGGAIYTALAGKMDVIPEISIEHVGSSSNWKFTDRTKVATLINSLSDGVASLAILKAKKEVQMDEYMTIYTIGSIWKVVEYDHGYENTNIFISIEGYTLSYSVQDTRGNISSSDLTGSIKVTTATNIFP